MLKTQKFSTKVIAMLFVFSLAIILSFSFFAYWMIKDSVMKQMQNDGLTLIKTIKRELENYDVSNLNEIQLIFSEVKEKSEGSIIYISLSNLAGELVVSDEAVLIDAASSASETEDATEATSSGDEPVLVQVSNDVFNISEPLSNGEYVLNVGLSLTQLQSQIQNALLWIGIMGLFFVAMVFIIGNIVTRSLLKVLKTTIDQLHIFANGDLTLTFDESRKDEFGKLGASLSEVSRKFKTTIGESANTITHLESISSEISDAKARLFQSTMDVSNSSNVINQVINEQNLRIDHMTSNGNALSDQLTQMGHMAETIQNHNQKIDVSTQSGSEKLSNLLGSMNQVSHSLDAGTSEIKSLNENFGNISDFTTVINGVAQQTNLLALNAAIEAARAGEAGRGFAVVADEIKKLAEQVIQASNNISDLINSTQSAVDRVTNQNDEISELINRQKHYIQDTVNAFQSIKTETTESLNVVSQFSSEIQHITRNNQNMMSTIDSLNQISNKINAAETGISHSVLAQKDNIDQFDAYLKGINKLCEKLSEGISYFKV
ncbi:MAG: methyl-accepting chemotaxis protein [Firmicutes bacterium]|nr:methyl-accepting chemotaxis protein [Bacillota bacterium]